METNTATYYIKVKLVISKNSNNCANSVQTEGKVTLYLKRRRDWSSKKKKKRKKKSSRLSQRPFGPLKKIKNK